MIIEFSVTNFRSIKEEQIFSFVAEASKSKPDNIFDAKIRQGIDLKTYLKAENIDEIADFETVRLLKSAVIYGANASGKSNIIKAFEVFQKMCLNANTSGQSILYYNPFLFDTEKTKAETVFKFSFIGAFDYKYEYEFGFNETEITFENLNYFPLGQSRNLFKRIKGHKKRDRIKTGTDLKIKTSEVFENQLFLTLFGLFEPNPILSKIYDYFKNQFLFFNTTDTLNLDKWTHEIGEMLSKNGQIKNELAKLIHVADTKIMDLELQRNDNLDITEKVYEPIGIHKIRNSEERVRLHFDEESRGTNMLYVLGGKILEGLKKGGTIFIDEIDTSLHPRLAKFLIMLFQHKTSNPKNAQLIFTTHETTFLDKDLFRREQIWFTEKNEFGETELYSMQDFDNVREDTPFEKWYLAGKFGGLPNIKELNLIFDNGKTEN